MTLPKLNLGQGPGCRLLTPGLPDQLLATKGQLLWISDDVVFIQRGKDVSLFSCGGVSGLAYGPARWALLSGEENNFTLRTMSDAHHTTVCSVSGRAVILGTDWSVIDHGAERQVIETNNGSEVSVPVGAQDARTRPWLSGRGVTWTDGPQIYRYRKGGRVKTAGRLSSPPQRWLSGPEGSAVFETKDGLISLGPKGGLHELPSADFESIRFSEDGLEITAAGPDGALRVTLKTGSVLESGPQDLVPIGYTDEPVFLDEDAGVVRTWSGGVLGQGFQPCAASRLADRLYGPGGTAWDIATGTRAWTHAPLCGAHLVATPAGVIQVDERIEVYSLDGVKVFDLPLPIDEEIDGEIIEVHWADDRLVFELEDGWAQVDMSGRRVNNNPPTTEPEHATFSDASWRFDEALGAVSNGATTWPVWFDGAATTGDGRLLAWNEDGLLLCLTTPAAPAE